MRISSGWKGLPLTLTTPPQLTGPGRHIPRPAEAHGRRSNLRLSRSPAHVASPLGIRDRFRAAAVDKPYRVTSHLLRRRLSPLPTQWPDTNAQRHFVLISVVARKQQRKPRTPTTITTRTPARRHSRRSACQLTAPPQCLRTVLSTRRRIASPSRAACRRPYRRCRLPSRRVVLRPRTSPKHTAKRQPSSSRVACPRRCRRFCRSCPRLNPMTKRRQRSPRRLSGRRDHPRSRSGVCI